MICCLYPAQIKETFVLNRNRKKGREGGREGGRREKERKRERESTNSSSHEFYPGDPKIPTKDTITK